MGKARRLRQKYHNLLKNQKEDTDTSRNIDKKGLTYDEIVAGNFDRVNVSSKPTHSDSNIFSGLNIDVANLRTTLIEDDRISVRSIAKSMKYDANGKLLKKDEKRKLRHDLFMQRLDFIQKAREETKRRNKKKNKKGELTNVNTANVNDIPQLVKIEKKDKLKVIKKKGIEKTRKRHKTMLEDISAFGKILQDAKFKANPFGCISESVNNRLLEDAKNV